MDAISFKNNCAKRCDNRRCLQPYHLSTGSLKIVKGYPWEDVRPYDELELFKKFLSEIEKKAHLAGFALPPPLLSVVELGEQNTQIKDTYLHVDIHEDYFL